jgi:hypothetical protein
MSACFPGGAEPRFGRKLRTARQSLSGAVDYPVEYTRESTWPRPRLHRRVGAGCVRFSESGSDFQTVTVT